MGSAAPGMRRCLVLMMVRTCFLVASGGVVVSADEIPVRMAMPRLREGIRRGAGPGAGSISGVSSGSSGAGTSGSEVSIGRLVILTFQCRQS
ncbi:hypothetical protein QBC47DRAFT_394023 [Echria macrotheca]|uniref:Secreted protein n=1 Tax=Echria macrotheca TaxID=438768 RepID=A0AAJ0F0S1_9PEZI|nr:hypothetical protein QBC47DRAFT_394023 [Echria macrotheca]